MITAKDVFNRLVQDTEMSDNGWNTFYLSASSLLQDIADATRGDVTAPPRISKIVDFLEHKMSPGLRRGIDVHVIMLQLRQITTPVNDPIEEMVEYSEDEVVCIVIQREPKLNERVELIPHRALELRDDSPFAYFLRHPDALVSISRSISAGENRPLYAEAKKHLRQQATLQSLAVNIYLDRQGHLTDNDRARWRETFRRDLRKNAPG